jgi:hypothetical protein
MSSRDELEQLFRNLPDEELIARGSSGGLTNLAQEVANAEAKARGLGFKPLTVMTDEPVTEPGIYHGDMQMIANPLTPTEAQMVVSMLRAGGVPAEAGDTHLVKGDSPESASVASACVRVPAEFVAEANELIAAFKRGEFALDKDFDVPV